MPSKNTSEKEITEIDVNLIDETPDNEWVFGYKEDDVERLANEINDVGFIGAIEVIDTHNGRYQVFSGHERLLAVKKIGWKKIPCIIEPDMTDVELYRRTLSSNILQRKMSPLNYARAIETFKIKVLRPNKKRGQGSERDQCAAFFNVSRGNVQRYEAILKMPEYIQNLCDSKTFPFTALESAVTLDEDQKEELAAKIRSYISRFGNDEPIPRSLVLQYIDTIKGRKNTERLIDDTASEDYEDIQASLDNNQMGYLDDIFYKQDNEDDENDDDMFGENIEYDNVIDAGADETDIEEYIDTEVVRINNSLSSLRKKRIKYQNKQETINMLKQCKKTIDSLLKQLN